MDDDIFEKPREDQPAPPADRGIPSVAATTTKQYILGGIFLAVAAVAIVFVVIDGMKKGEPKSYVQAEEISFKNAGASSTPYIEPAPAEPQQELQPAGPVQEYDPLAAQRELAMQQEALRMAQEQKKRMEQRIASPQMIYDQAGGGTTASSAAGQTTGGSGTLLGGEDPNVAFANQNANLEVETATANQLQNLNSLIAQGTMISGILETAIQSDLPGMVRAVISEDVYSFDGSHLLIPQGSKLVGRYKSGVVRGQSRVFVIWNRMIRNDGVSVNIGSYGTDALGRSGLDGEIDTHFFERFGSSVLLSMIDAGLKIGVNAMDDTDSATVALKTGDDFSRASEIALENSIAIPPTIHVDQGKRIKVFVGKDLDFSQVAGNIPRE